MNSRQHSEFDRIDGPMKFEWKNFCGFTTLQILAEFQNIMSEIKCELEHFLGLVIFMSMFYDIVWWKKGNREIGVPNSLIGAEYVENLRKDIGRFLGLDQRRNGTELTHANRMESGIVSLILC